MSMNTREIIDIIFIPLYFILFLVALYVFIQHSANKRIAFGLLFMFPLIRCVGNILLVVAYQDSKKSNPNVKSLSSLFTAGFVLELAGFGIIVGATLNLLSRAAGFHHHQQKDNRQTILKGPLGFIIGSPARLLHLLNTVASVLLIVGITQSTSAFTLTPNGAKISNLSLIGCILILVEIGLIFLLSIYHLFVIGPVTNSAKLILLFVLCSCIPMATRMAWSTYKISSSDLQNVNVWCQLVLQYLAECLATSILLALSFTLIKNGGDKDLDDPTYFHQN